MDQSLRWWDYWLKDEDTGLMDEPVYWLWVQDSVRSSACLPVNHVRQMQKPGCCLYLGNRVFTPHLRVSTWRQPRPMAGKAS